MKFSCVISDLKTKKNRERHKSAAWPRIKNRKNTSKRGRFGLKGLVALKTSKNRSADPLVKAIFPEKVTKPKTPKAFTVLLA